MSIPENLLHFSETKENIPHHNHSNFLYLFKTKLDNEDGKSFVKIGLTEKQTLLGRLDDYKPYSNIALTVYPTQINYIHTQGVRLRETLIKRVLNKHPEIEVYHNDEYFKGPYKLLIKIFSFIGLLDIEDLSQYIYKETISKLLNAILELEVALIEKDSSSKYLNCSKCGKECKNKRGLHIHEASCTGATSLECEGCNKVFYSTYVLQRHIPSCPVLEKTRLNKAVEEQVKFIREEYEKRLQILETEKHNLHKSYNIRIESIIKEFKGESNKYEDQLNALRKQVNDLTLRNQNIEDERKMLTRNILNNWKKLDH